MNILRGMIMARLLRAISLEKWTKIMSSLKQEVSGMQNAREPLIYSGK